MKQNFYKLLALTGVMLCCNMSEAQELRTSYFMQTSLYRHQMNPALLDSAYVGMPFLGNIQLSTTGNVGVKTFVYKSHETEYDLTTFMSPEVSTQEFMNNLHNKNRVDVYLNYNLLSIGFKKWKGTNLLELNLKSNTHVVVPKELFAFMKDAGEKEFYKFENIGANTQNYLEIALGHSHNINKKWRVGGKMKFLLGVAYSDFNVKHMNVTMNDDQWIVNSDAEIASSVLKGKWKYDTNDDPNTCLEGKNKVSGIDVDGFDMPGFGMAFDMGVTYKPIDRLTVSAALTDLGYIHWKKALRARSQGTYTFDGFSNVEVVNKDEPITGEDIVNKKLDDQFDDLGDDLDRLFSLYEEKSKSKTQALAATLNMGAEYTMRTMKFWRWGFLYTSRIQGKYSWHQGMFSTMLRPVKWIEMCFNTAFSSTGVTYGGMLSFYAKKFNFYIATDQFTGKLNNQGIPLKRANSSVNLGLNFPL